MNTEFVSSLTGQKYNIKDVVRILNVSQASAYWINGIKPVDIYPSRHYETGSPVLVFLFNKEESADAYDKWCNYELK